MTDHCLVCMDCDRLVAAALDYDGYHGTCGCQRFGFRVGSGDRPRSWTTVDEAGDPDHFQVQREGLFYGGDTADRDRVVCRDCKQSDPVAVEIDRVDLARFDLKATFTCENTGEHKMDRGRSAVAYYTSGYGDGKALVELAGGVEDE